MSWQKYLVLALCIVFILVNVVALAFGTTIFNQNSDKKFSMKSNFIHELHDFRVPEVIYFRAIYIFSLVLPVLILAGFNYDVLFNSSTGYYLFLSYLVFTIFLIASGFSAFTKPVNIKLFVGFKIAKMISLLSAFVFLSFACIFKFNPGMISLEFSSLIPYLIIMIIALIFVVLMILSFANKKLYTWYKIGDGDEQVTNYLAYYDWIYTLFSYVFLILFLSLYFVMF